MSSLGNSNIDPNLFKVKITLISGADGYISAVFVKPYYSSTPCTTPTAPAVSNPSAYCKNSNAIPLTATGATGAILKWYYTQSGGNGTGVSYSTITPSTTTEGSTNYYVSQTVNGCESQVATITATVTSVDAPNVQDFDMYLNKSGSVYSNKILTGSGCSDIGIYFYNNSTQSSDNTNTANWDFNPPANSTNSSSSSWSPSSPRFWNNAGDIICTLKITSTNGCTNSFTKNITIYPIPTSTAGSNSPICTGATLNLTCSSSVISGATYAWTGPTGFSSSEQNPIIPNTTAAMSGTYNVTVSANGCTSSPAGTTNVIINPIPTAPTIGTITSPTCTIPTGSVVLGGLPSSGIWTINPNSITGTGTSHIVSLLPCGTYNFTVINAFGCISAASADVVISPIPTKPTIPIIATITQPSCTLATGSVVLNGLPSSGNWIINPGNISGTGTSHTVSSLSSGTYNFTVTNSCGTSVASANVIINSPPISPTAPIIGAITQPSCTSPIGSVELDGLPPSESWVINPGNISGTGTTHTISVSSSGTYNFTVTNSSGCISSASANVVINALNIPNAPTITNPGTYCLGASASPLTASGTNLLWYTASSGVTGSSIAPTPSTTTAGIFNYYVSQTLYGCESTKTTITVTVSSTQNIFSNGFAMSVDDGLTYTSTSNIFVCTGEPVRFGNTSYIGTPSTNTNTTPTTLTGYFSNWDFPNAITDNANEILTTSSHWSPNMNRIWNNTGVTPITIPVTLTLSVTQSGCISSLTKNIIVNPITITGTQPTCNTSGTGGITINIPSGTISGMTYSIDNGVSYSSATNYTSLTDGTYIVKGKSTKSDYSSDIITLATVTISTPSAPDAPTAASPQIFCSANNPTVNDLVASGSANSIINWYNTSTGVNALPNSTALTGTTYYVSQTVNGCESSRTAITVIVNASPSNPEAINGITGICNGQQEIVNYHINPISNATSYIWSLPTGASGTSNSNSINVTYNTSFLSGNISVCGNNSCGNGNNSSLTITTIPLPTITGILNVCVGSTTQLTGSGNSAGVDYAWYSYMPNVATVDHHTGLVTGVTPGTCNIQYTNNNNCLASTTVTVNSLPAIAGTITGTTTVCQGQNSVTYSVPAIANATSYVWTLPTGTIGTSTTSSITVSYSNTAVSGNISVYGTNSCGNGTSSTLAITVNPLTANAGTISGSTTVCQGQNTFTYTVPAIANATSYVWTLPTGVTGTSTTNSISVSYNSTATSGNISVYGTNTCGNGTSSSLAITVNPLPATAGTITGTTTICQGQNSVTYTVPAITNVTSYVWTLPTGATGTSTTNSITVNYSATATSGNITVKGHNTCGNGTSSSLAITVTPNNTINLTSAIGTNTQIVCINTPITNITYATTGATGAIFTGLPTGVNGVFSAETGVITISGIPSVSSGIAYNYTINLSGGCGTITTTGSIIVSPNNIVTLTSAAGSNAQNVCINTTITNITYSTTGASGIGVATGLPSGVTATWASNTITISGTPTASGIFNYSIPLTGGCGNVIATGTITVKPNNTITLTSAAGTNSQTVCINTAITNISYSTTGATGASFTGLPNGVNKVYSGGVVHIYGTPSVSSVNPYTYTVLLTGGCGTITTTGTIAVINTLPSDAETISGLTEVCQGQTSGIYTVSSIANASSYIWTLPSGASGSSTTSNITVSFGTSAISGNITVIGHNSCGNGSSSSFPITVNTNTQTPIIEVHDNCDGSSSSLLITNPLDNATFTWSSNSLTGNPAIATTAGTYSVIQTDVNGCISPPGTATVQTAIPLPSTYNFNWNGNNTATWSSNAEINNYVVIPSGKTLIIGGTNNNITLQFTANSIFTVEPGGKLIINNATLTSACYTNPTWWGIVVQGISTKSQLEETYQGIIEITNSTIENSILGIKTEATSYADRGAGIIRADNTRFINNGQAIEMLPYQNFNPANISSKLNDLSYFNNCEFIINDDLTNTFGAFVIIDKISGLNFNTCKFNNLNTNTSIQKTGYGINSTDSKFYVNSSCSVPVLFGMPCPDINISNIEASEFNNLEYGIAAFCSYPDPTRFCVVKNAVFTNNLHGLYTLNSINDWFTSNNFKIPNNYSSSEEVVSNTYATAYGMYLDHSSNYTVEGNTFDKVNNDANTHNASYGLIINEAGPNTNNTIYNNSFSNIEHASTQAQGKNNNYPTIPATGLQILCNQYSSNKQDVTVVPPGASGISTYQGASGSDVAKPAGNTFTKFGDPLDDLQTDFNNQGTILTYYHHTGANNNIWVPEWGNSYPNKFINQPEGMPLPSDRSLACPPKALQIVSPYDNISLSNLINAKSVQLNSTKLILDIWVDGGNTEGLRQEIKYAYPWETYQLYAELINKSPYLSDDVMIDAIKREDILPALMLKLVLLANPQSVRSEKVWEALINRVNPLPEEMIEEIEQGIDVISPKNDLEADVAYYTTERKTYLDLLKMYYMADTTGNGLNNLIQLLSNETDIDSRYELVFAQISNQDNEKAIKNLAAIGDLINPEKQTEEFDRFTKMSNIIPLLIAVESGDSTWDNISETAKSLFIDLSENDNGLAGSISRAVGLQFDKEYVYDEPIYTCSNEPLKKAIIKKGGKNAIKTAVLKISPNPADEFITVSYEIIGTINGLRLFITDALGKTVFEKELNKANDEQLLSIKDYAKGNYNCILFNNGKITKSGKFIKK